MTFNEYRQLAMRTNSPHSSKDELQLNAILGLCGESGELADVVKKSRFQGHELSLDDISDELGDILWYIAQACEGFGFDMDELAERNIAKLKKRYPQGFESDRSIYRD